jgi:oligopeptide transport system permease protein
MLKNIFNRLLWNLGTLIVIIFCSFSLIRLAPGNPFQQERALDPLILEELKKKFDFSFFEYISGIIRGNFQYSFSKPDTLVSEILFNALPVSLELGFLAMSFALISGLILGGISAQHKNSVIDPIIMILALTGIAIPNFVIGPILQLFWGIQLQLLPVAGWVSIQDRILPVFALSLTYIAYISRLFRSSVIESLGQDFILTARSKGLNQWQIFSRHSLRNSLLPVCNYLAPATAAVLSGTMVIEKIFYIPGLGRHFVESAILRDYPVALGVIIIYSILLLGLNFLADIISIYIDPRIHWK